MSIKARKTSATALVAAPAVKAPTDVQTSNVVNMVIPPAPNAHDPKAATKVEVFVSQDVVDAYLNAETAVSETQIALFYACCLHRVSVAQFKGRSDAKVRASEFNCANNVANYLGVKAARALIDQACKRSGDKRAATLAALRAAIKVGKETKASALKGAALQKEIMARVNEAAADQDAKSKASTEGRRSGSRATRVPGLPKANSLDGYMPILIAALIDAEKQLAGLDIPPRKLKKVEALASALNDALACANEVSE